MITSGLDINLLMDGLLILLAAAAALYCAILSRRLKKLTSLDEGLGASILSLTEAIEQTNRAAMQAQDKTRRSVDMLARLLSEAETMTPKIEALCADAQYSREKLKSDLRESVEACDLARAEALSDARQAAQQLQAIAKDVRNMRAQKSVTTLKRDAA